MICNFYSAPYIGTQPPLCWEINNTWAELITKQQNPAIWPTKPHSSLCPSILLFPSLHQFSFRVGPLQLSQRSSSLSSAKELVNTDASFIREVSSHRRCGLVMISRDYDWLMVGKYIRNHRLWEGEGILLTLADLHWSTANEWGLAASSYLPTDK